MKAHTHAQTRAYNTHTTRHLSEDGHHEQVLRAGVEVADAAQVLQTHSTRGGAGKGGQGVGALAGGRLALL